MDSNLYLHKIKFGHLELIRSNTQRSTTCFHARLGVVHIGMRETAFYNSIIYIIYIYLYKI